MPFFQIQSDFFGTAMPAIDFAKVRSLVSLAQVLDLLGLTDLDGTADQVRGPCPIHGSQTGKSRSFSAHLAKNMFQCFKCGAAGNQLDLWAAATKQDIFHAAQDLCRVLKIGIPLLGAKNSSLCGTEMRNP
jgi:DNA primase